MAASIQRSSPLFDQIYDVLWQRITEGEIRVGSRISDLEWSSRLGVSRTPVREAMRKLQQDGVLLPLDRGGYELRKIDAGGLAHLYACRSVLEGLAAHDAAGNITDEQLAGLRQTLDQSDHALETEEFHKLFDLNTQFHDQIMRVAGNPYLERLLRDLSRLILLARSSLMAASKGPPYAKPYLAHMLRVQDDHLAVLAALETRDPDASRRAMEVHMANTTRGMVALIEELAQAAGND